MKHRISGYSLVTDLVLVPARRPGSPPRGVDVPGALRVAVAAVTHYLPEPLQRPADHAPRLPGLELPPYLDQSLISQVEPPRQQRCELEPQGRVVPEQARGLRDAERRALQGADVRRVRLIQQHGQLAEYRAGL